jgi:hypothetical protein
VLGPQMVLNHNSNWVQVRVLLSLLQDRGQLEGSHLQYFDGGVLSPCFEGLIC